MKTPFFKKFFSTICSAKNITDERLQAFIRSLIESLKLDNPSGIFDTEIAALTAGYSAYFGNYVIKRRRFCR